MKKSEITEKRKENEMCDEKVKKGSLIWGKKEQSDRF